MSPIARILAAGAAALAVTASAAVAQNYSLDPTYGTASLNAGFTPDPFVVNVQAGGERQASNVSSSCRGMIANRPDVRLNYNSGNFPLIISVNASADTTLVINGPNGEWYCDDDGGEGFNPSIRLNSPRSGQYDIWVGTYSSGSLQPSQLHISEISSQ